MQPPSTEDNRRRCLSARGSLASLTTNRGAVQSLRSNGVLEGGDYEDFTITVTQHGINNREPELVTILARLKCVSEKRVRELAGQLLKRREATDRDYNPQPCPP
jgi:hypothetical protein